MRESERERMSQAEAAPKAEKTDGKNARERMTGMFRNC